MSIFNSLLKHKRIGFSLVLFFVLLGILLPNRVEAQFGPIAKVLRLGFAGIKAVIPSLEQIAIAILEGLAYSIYYIGYTAAYVLSYVFSAVTNILLKDELGRWAITNIDTSYLAPVFVAAWNAVKLWANIILTLGFIGVAVAFILSLDQYKKLLVPLLITALLINFSLVFVGFMIDIANIAMLSFLGINTVDSSTGMVGQIHAIWGELDKRTPDIVKAAEFFGISSYLGLIHLTVAATFFWLILTYVIRYAMLAILFILSPLAFALRVFPFEGAKKAWSTWWQQFLKWCFAGLIATFFLRLAMDVLASFNPEFIDTSGAQAIYIALVKNTTHLLIVLMFMLIGLKLAMKSSAIAKLVMAATAAIVAAIITGGASLAGTVGKGALKMGGKGLTKLGSKEGWKSMASGIKSAAGKAFSLEGIKTGARGIRAGARGIRTGARAGWEGLKAAPGVGLRGIKAAPGALMSGVSALWQTGGAAVSAIKDPNVWRNGWEATKNSINAAPGSVWQGIKTGAPVAWKGITTGAGATTDMALNGMATALRGAGIVLSGRSNIKATVSDWATRVGEWSGAIDPGTADLAQQERNRKKTEEPLKRYKAVQENRGSQALFNMRKSAVFDEERAAIDTVLAQNDALYLLGNKEKQQEAMNNAMRFGISGSDFTKNNADLVDAKKFKEFMARYDQDIKNGMSLGEAQTKATRDVQSHNFAMMKIDNIENMSDKDVIKEAKEKTARGAKFLHEANKRNILDMIDDDYKVVGELMQESNDKYRSNTLREAIKSNPLYRKYDRPAIERRAREIAVTKNLPWQTTYGDAEQELVNEDYQRTDKISNLSKSAMGNVAFLRNIRAKSLGKQIDRLPTSKFNELKKWVTDPVKMSEMRDELDRLRLAGKNKEADNLKDVIDKINTA